MRSCQPFMMHSFHAVSSGNLRQYSLTLSVRKFRTVKTARRRTSDIQATHLILRLRSACFMQDEYHGSSTLYLLLHTEHKSVT